MADRADVPLDIVEGLRVICLGLPETYEETAWVGCRWRVRGRTFAHVLTIDSGHPHANARPADHDGPILVLTFRAEGPELDALTHAGPPWFRWGRNALGLVLGDPVDWDEVAELLTDSYLVLAPKKLAARVVS